MRSLQKYPLRFFCRLNNPQQLHKMTRKVHPVSWGRFGRGTWRTEGGDLLAHISQQQTLQCSGARDGLEHWDESKGVKKNCFSKLLKMVLILTSHSKLWNISEERATWNTLQVFLDISWHIVSFVSAVPVDIPIQYAGQQVQLVWPVEAPAQDARCSPVTKGGLS